MELDNEESWFYDSMTRYKQLRMFEHAHVIRHMALSDTKSICVVGTHERSGKDEIIELILPEKLTVPEETNGLVKDCDLKVNKGGFSKSKILQMEAFVKCRKLVTSEEDQFGVTIYDLSSTSSDLIDLEKHYLCEHKSPSFSVKRFETILLASNSMKPILVMDMTNGNIIQMVNIDQSQEGSIEPKYLSENLIAACIKSSGRVIISDLRANPNSTKSTKGSYILDAHTTKEPRSSMWTLSSTNPYAIEANSISTKLSCISTNGVCVLYDLRSSKVPLFISSLNLKKDDICSDHSQTLRNVSLSMWGDSGLFSVSGFDENVYIKRINLENKIKSIFTHDGHKHGCEGAESVVTCHMWYKKDILVSAAQNKSLHCWQFVAT